MSRLLPTLALGSSLLVVGLSIGAGARAAPVRVIDRTFLCTNTAQAGVRKVTVGATKGFREGGEWKWLASAGVSNAGAPLVKLPPNEKGIRGTDNTNWFVAMGAGEGAVSEGRFGNNPGVSIRTRTKNGACSPSSEPVQLSPRGLPGGAADYFGDEYECPVPRRILVRVRGAFRSPVSLRRDRSWGPSIRTMRANGPVQEGSFAVRTQSGKPLVFATVSEAGAARLFTARSCV